MPPALLARYFQKKQDVLHQVLFGNSASDIESIFQAFTALPVEQQRLIEVEFQEINAMACQGGFSALVEVATHHLDEGFIGASEEINGFHGKVMWAFLDHPAYWDAATLFLHADNITDSTWRKRKNFIHIQPFVGESNIRVFELTLCEYFHKKQGRGRNCKVDVLKRHTDKWYFFAYPEDYAQSAVEWVRNSLSTSARNPAFEIIFVYTPHEGSLDIYAPRNTKSVPALQRIFAISILCMSQLDPYVANKRVYNLDVLADRDFVFQFPWNYGIESVVVRSLRLRVKSSKKCIVTVVVDPSDNPHEIYDRIDSLNVPPFFVTQAEISVTFMPTPGVRSNVRTFQITHPDLCALRHDGRDLIIRQMLIQSGIEPQEIEGDIST